MITRRVKRARIRSAVLVTVLAAALAVFAFRRELFDPALDRPVRLLTAAALLGLGWAFARDVQRALEPALFRRLERGTAGTMDFLLRLATILVITIAAL